MGTERGAGDGGAAGFGICTMTYRILAEAANDASGGSTAGKHTEVEAETVCG
ncbi:hypothetical protein STXM2123_373 [Streptomyces sp. F-3]|nr:hypothetical protein STXM2123_373 [Streptomyces sp. F-3]